MLPVIGALDLDPMSVNRQWTATGAEYMADVQRCVFKAVEDQPDAAEMVRAFFRFATDETVVTGSPERRLIHRLGRILSARWRWMNPGRYWAPARYAQHRGVAAIPDSAFLTQALAAATEVE